VVKLGDEDMKIGVLALQGAFIEHIHILQALGIETVEVRLPKDLDSIDAIIIPGGESTTIGKLALMYNLINPLRHFSADKPVWGTCAGMVLMAKEIGRDQTLLGVMDIVVERNAFGRQVDSFETNLYVNVLKDWKSRPFPCVFIRSPRLVKTRGKAKEIARLEDGTAVAAREGKLLVTSFHPELTEDIRFHQYFMSLV